MNGETRDRSSSEVRAGVPKEFRELVDQMERTHHAIEAIGNRINTLVRLLDLLKERVDRLESQR